MISDDGRFYFFHNPKAAGTSICRMLETQSSYQCVRNDNNHALNDFLKSNEILWPNHAHPKWIREFLGVEKYSSLFKFSFVRDPRERLVSLYFYVKQKEQQIYENAKLEMPAINREIMESTDFESWILDSQHLPPPQMDFFCEQGEMMFDFIGKTEHVSRDFNKIKSILGLADLSLPSTNVSQHKPASDYFSAASNQKAFELYKIDFEYFGYAID